MSIIFFVLLNTKGNDWSFTVCLGDVKGSPAICTLSTLDMMRNDDRLTKVHERANHCTQSDF